MSRTDGVVDVSGEAARSDSELEIHVRAVLVNGVPWVMLQAGDGPELQFEPEKAARLGWDIVRLATVALTATVDPMDAPSCVAVVPAAPREGFQQ